MVPQVRIAEGDNTAQYCPNSAASSRLLLLGQCRRLYRSSSGSKTAIFIDCLNLPTLSRNLAQYGPYTKPIVTFTMASSSECRRARVTFTTSNHFGCEKTRVRHSIGPLLCRKQVPAARVWARIGRQELLFQQRHDTGNRSSVNFWQCWASVGPYLTSHFDRCIDLK